VLLLLAAGALTGASATPGPARPAGTGRPLSQPLVVHGHVRGLYPGASKRARVVVRNRADVVVRLERLRVHVADASPACLATNVVIRGFRGSAPIPAGGTIQLRLRTRMGADVPDACEGARFPLTFSTRIARG
jgi:hypothetical protein